jgi:hypothetical protein
MLYTPLKIDLKLEKFSSGYTSRNTCTLRHACVAQRIKRTATAREVPSSRPADINSGKSSLLGVIKASNGKSWVGTRVEQRVGSLAAGDLRMRLRSPQRLIFYRKKIPLRV